MKKTLCLFQIFKPSQKFTHLDFPHWHKKMGDCTICEPDEKNVNCSGYFPVTIVIMEVKEEK